MNLWLERIPSPIGTILLVSDGEVLRALDFEDYEGRLRQLLRRYCGSDAMQPGRAPGDTSQRLAAYFDGNLRALDAVPIWTGGSEFQHRVWQALRQIAPGTTTTYGRLAASIGAPRASRAVGLANGANPIALVVPCHRVIGANASLTGYGGGLARKAWLLQHETGARAGTSQSEPA